MKQKQLFALWGVMFIVCSGLGFIPEPRGLLQGVLTVCALVFFIPGALLLRLSVQRRDRQTLSLVRNLAAASLGLTLVLLVLNFLAALRSEVLGDVLYYVLTIVSSPMVCSGYWVLSLFLWACLLTVSIQCLNKCPKPQ